MSELFQAVFSGEVLKGADPTEVRKQLEDLGVLKGAQGSDAFGGKPVVLRSGLTREQADRFSAALATAQARCQVLPESWVVCPACGFQQEAGEECVRCGLIFAKHHADPHPAQETEPSAGLRTREEIARDLESAGYRRHSEDSAER